VLTEFWYCLLLSEWDLQGSCFGGIQPRRGRLWSRQSRPGGFRLSATGWRASSWVATPSAARHLVGSLPSMFSSFRESCLPLSACISGWFCATAFQSLLLPANGSTRLPIAPSTESYSRTRVNG